MDYGLTWLPLLLSAWELRRLYTQSCRAGVGDRILALPASTQNLPSYLGLHFPTGTIAEWGEDVGAERISPADPSVGVRVSEKRAQFIPAGNISVR